MITDVSLAESNRIISSKNPYLICGWDCRNNSEWENRHQIVNIDFGRLTKEAELILKFRESRECFDKSGWKQALELAKRYDKRYAKIHPSTQCHTGSGSGFGFGYTTAIQSSLLF